MRWTEADYGAHMAKTRPASATGKTSKYRNRRVVVDGIAWDSQHEADRYLALKALAGAGAIDHLRWKVRFSLNCPVEGARDSSNTVSHYVADFVYREHGHGHEIVEDTKGYLTAMYKLKRKWMLKQYGITIREVYRRAAS